MGNDGALIVIHAEYAKYGFVQNSKWVVVFLSNTVNYTDLTTFDNFPKSNTRISDVQG